jgi:hypothetical protein
MMLDSGTSGRGRVVRCEMVGEGVAGSAGSTFGDCGRFFGWVRGDSFRVCWGGWGGSIGGMSVEALWVACAATSGRQRMRLRDPVGRPLVRGHQYSWLPQVSWGGTEVEGGVCKWRIEGCGRRCGGGPLLC